MRVVVCLQTSDKISSTIGNLCNNDGTPSSSDCAFLSVTSNQHRRVSERLTRFTRALCVSSSHGVAIRHVARSYVGV
jgi:hypothetical protein